MGQRGPEEAGELARDGGDDVLSWLCRGPSVVDSAGASDAWVCQASLDDGSGCATLAQPEGASKKRMMPVLAQADSTSTRRRCAFPVLVMRPRA